MQQIYWADSGRIRRKSELGELMRDLPKGIRERALRYRSEEAAFNFVIGRLLLRHGLEQLGKSEMFRQIEYLPKGKPMIEGIHFNIAHSGARVVAAFAECEIGVDIEQIREVNLADFDAFFTGAEWEEIYAAANSQRAFLELWTRKESIIKCLSVSLKELNRVDELFDTNAVYFRRFELFDASRDVGMGRTSLESGTSEASGYLGSLCGKCEIGEIELLEVLF